MISLGNGQLSCNETDFHRKDGTTVPVRTFSLKAECDSEGIEIGCVIDMTKEVQSARLTETFRRILDHEWQKLGIHIVDRNGKIEWMNRRGMQILNPDADSLKELED